MDYTRFAYIGICIMSSLLLFACKDKGLIKSNVTVEDNKESMITYGNLSKEIEVKAKEKPLLVLNNGLKDSTLLKVGLDEDSYGLTDINIKGHESNPLFVKDPVYDVIYFVNSEDNYHIYRLRDDGIAECVVEIPAKSLYTNEGILYFIVDIQDQYQCDENVVQNGNIISYDPLTGNVERIVNQSVAYMYVYEDGIYFNERILYEAQEYRGGILTHSAKYVYSFRDKSVKQLENNFTLYRWKDDYYFYKTLEDVDNDTWLDVVQIDLMTLDKEQSIYSNKPSEFRNYSLYGDKILYYSDSQTFIIYDIITKAKEEIQLGWDIESDSYTIIDHMIYIGGNYVYDTNRNMLSFVESNGVFISSLYTDGKDLYGLCSDSTSPISVIRKVELVDVSSDSEISMASVGNGLNMELHRYTYDVTSLGD